MGEGEGEVEGIDGGFGGFGGGGEGLILTDGLGGEGEEDVLVMPDEIEMILLRRLGVSSEFRHDGFEGAFVVLEETGELSILALERLILLDERNIQSLQFGLKLLEGNVRIEATEGEASLGVDSLRFELFRASVQLLRLLAVVRELGRELSEQ